MSFYRNDQKLKKRMVDVLMQKNALKYYDPTYGNGGVLVGGMRKRRRRRRRTVWNDVLAEAFQQYPHLEFSEVVQIAKEYYDTHYRGGVLVGGVRSGGVRSGGVRSGGVRKKKRSTYFDF